MKGHREDTYNAEQQVTTGLQICTCQVEVDNCDSSILLPTCLGQNQMCSQQPGSQGSKTSAFSMETLRCAPRRRARQQEGGFFKPCQRTGQRSQAWRHLASLVLSSCPFLIWPHRYLLPVGRPASLSVCPPDAPRGVKASGRGESREFQSRKPSVSLHNW